jgi:hypothetical protein
LSSPAMIFPQKNRCCVQEIIITESGQIKNNVRVVVFLQSFGGLYALPKSTCS